MILCKREVDCGEGGPAQLAGLREGDVIVALDGKPHHAAFLGKIIEAHQAPMQRGVLGRHADLAAADFAFPEEASGDELRGIDADGKAQPSELTTKALSRATDCDFNCNDLIESFLFYRGHLPSASA
jgi:hypothetical protein